MNLELMVAIYLIGFVISAIGMALLLSDWRQIESGIKRVSLGILMVPLWGVFSALIAVVYAVALRPAKASS